MQKRIYLDWNASSPLSKNAFLAMKSTFANFANPSSSHYEGRAAKKAIEKARDKIAEIIGLNTRFNIIFTSGATESAAMVLHHKNLNCAPIEHECVKKWSCSNLVVNKNGKVNSEFQDERILRTIFNQSLNEEGNIINIDKDEGLAISIVTEIVEPRQLTLEESLEEVKKELSNKLKKEKAMKRANEIQRSIKNDKAFRLMAKKNKLEIKGVQPFTRILPDSSDLPIPLISKIFDSELFDINIETRGPNEIIIAQTVEIIDNLVKNKKELEEFSTRVKDDITIDLLAQFSEALRKKYKITINDDVIDQLN